MREQPLSKFTKDNTGIMGLTLSHIGLFVATGILLVAVVALLRSSGWQQTAELQSIASSFSSSLEDMDNTFFEHSTSFFFPEKDYPYSVKLSTEYIVLSVNGSQGVSRFIVKQFLTRPWVRSSAQNWTTGADLHAYLNTTYKHQGTVHDQLSLENFTDFIQERNASASFFALRPLDINNMEPVTIEKVTLYYNATERLDLLLVYQT